MHGMLVIVLWLNIMLIIESMVQGVVSIMIDLVTVCVLSCIRAVPVVMVPVGDLLRVMGRLGVGVMDRLGGGVMFSRFHVLFLFLSERHMVSWHVSMSNHWLVVRSWSVSSLVMIHNRMDLRVTRSFMAIVATIVVSRRVPNSWVDSFMRCVSWHVLVNFMRTLMPNNRLVHGLVSYGTVVLNRLLHSNSLV